MHVSTCEYLAYLYQFNSIIFAYEKFTTLHKIYTTFTITLNVASFEILHSIKIRNLHFDLLLNRLFMQLYCILLLLVNLTAKRKFHVKREGEIISFYNTFYFVDRS